MTKNTLFPLLTVLLLSIGISQAQEIVKFENAELKQRYLELLETTRCLVCQNQSLADSGAGLADDLRYEIERMVRDGKSDEEIVEFLVARYGDFVLYDPPFKPSTFFLWSAPVLLLILFALSMYFFFRKKKVDDNRSADIDDEKKRLAAKLLHTDNQN